MAKANIETPNGTKIIIDGKEEEIAKIINAISTNESYSQRHNSRNIKKTKMKSKMGLTDYIRELKEEGFLDQPKDLIEIKNELASKAHIYPVTSIHPTLIRLIKKGEVGRLKQDSKWVYVKR